MNHFRPSELKPIILSLLAASLVLSGCAAAAPEAPVIQLPTSTVQAMPDPTLEPAVTENPFGDWTEYRNENFGFRFLYPSDWFGPDVYESEGSLRLEVGSDQVYPYGTDRMDQITTIPDSYYITIQYNENSDGKSWEDYVNSGWIDGYLGLLEVENGDSISTPRSLSIRVSEVSLGSFQGLEYIATLPESAQTERVYLHEITAFDEDLNWLRITGSPNLVEIADPANWKADYQRVDQAYQEIFQTLAGSIEIK